MSASFIDIHQFTTHVQGLATRNWLARMGKSDSEVELESSQSQKFIPQANDDETLWEVTEILDEKGKQYKVRWKGNDPKTMKPWKPSWVPKHDCTDDLVKEWKRKKPEKGRRKSTKRGRAATATKRASTASTAKQPLSKAAVLSPSTGTTVNATTKRRGSSGAAHSRTTATATRKKLTGDAIPEESELDEPHPASKAPKGTKRKYAEADSANSSANRPSGRGGTVDVEVLDDETTGKKKTPVPIGRPSKKRKIEGTAKPESQSPLRSSLGQPRPPRTTTSIADMRQEEEGESVDDEEEERMVEDVLSEGLPSPTRNFDLDMNAQDDAVGPEHLQPSKNKGKARAVSDDEDEEEPPRTRNTQHISVSPPLSPPPARKVGPPKGKRPTQPNGTSKSKSKSKSASKEAEVPRPKKPVQTVKKPRIDSSRPYDTDSESEHDRPDLEWFVLQAGSPLTLHPSRAAATTDGYWDAPVGVSERDPVLSPKAWQRLEQFDLEMGLKKAKRKPAESNEEDEVEIVEEKEKTAEPERHSRSASSKGSVPIPSRYDNATNKPVSSTSSMNATEDPPTANPSANPPQRPANAHTNSYLTDVVPETDQEQSQSQERQQPEVARPSTPQGKPTLKSRMKPRTPLSRASSSAQFEANPYDKPMRPIPMLSPSSFHPLIQLDSSLPESIIESAGGEEDNRHRVSDEEEEAPMSSIEQFDTPEKELKTQGRKKVLLRKGRVVDRKGKGKEKQRDEDVDIWDSEQVTKRGQELAEAAKRTQRAKTQSDRSSAEEDEPWKGKRRSVNEIIARSRSRSESNTSARHPAAEDEDEPEEEGVADASTVVVPSGSGPQVEAAASTRPPEHPEPRPEHDMTLQQMKDVHVDMSGAVDETVDEDEASANPRRVDPELLRQEEEESTQDLMEEIRAGQMQMQQRGMLDVDMDARWAAGPSNSAPHDADDDDDDVSMGVPQIIIENPSRDPSTRSLSPEEDNDPNLVRRLTRSRSRSKTPSVASSKTSSSRARSVTLQVPVVNPPSRKSAEPSAARSRSKTPNLKQQGDDSILRSQFEKERSLNKALEHELASIREQFQQLKESTKNKDAEMTKRLSEIQALFKGEKEEWDGERTQLIIRVEAANKGKESAENDREFFREQYARASAFVSSVRDENKDLEKQAQIAEAQAKSGVSLVKATFEQHAKKLEDDAKVWRRMAEFAIEKDQRTNDEIRRRAAEEPGLRALCEKQEKELDQIHQHLAVAETELEGKEEDLARSSAELLQWKKQTMRLTGELNEALTKLDRIGRAGDENSQDDGHEFVYRCQWRLNVSNEACPETFLTLSELEGHLFTGRHLRSS